MDERRVIITEVNMITRYISARDVQGRIYQLTLDTSEPIVTVPDVGQTWIASRQGIDWRLVRLLESHVPWTAVETLNPGDKRLESTGNLYLNGTDVVVKGVAISDLIERIEELEETPPTTVEPRFYSIPAMTSPPYAQSQWNLFISQGLAWGGGYRVCQAQTGEISYPLWLSTGTWQILLTFTGSNDAGILTTYLNTNLVGTSDTYNGSTVYNQQITLTVPNVINGYHLLRLRSDTKNASSSGYFIYLQAIGLARTT